MDTNTTQVAKRSGVSYTTLASFVQGDTQSLRGATEAKITDAYNAKESEIFGGEQSSTREIPVIAWVSAGKLADPESQIPDKTETIEISGLPPGDYFGTRARGDSMDRIAPDNSLLIVDRADREPRKGRRYIFAMGGATTFKRFEVEPMPHLEPESLNPSHRPLFPKDGEGWDVIGRVRLVVQEI